MLRMCPATFGSGDRAGMLRALGNFGSGTALSMAGLAGTSLMPQACGHLCGQAATMEASPVFSIQGACPEVQAKH